MVLPKVILPIKLEWARYFLHAFSCCKLIGNHGDLMGVNQFNENQKTAWLDMSQEPVRNGKYELLHIQSKEILSGYYSNGIWKIEYRGELTPLRLPYSQIKWRGLNFEPTLQSLCDKNGVITIL